MPKWTRSIDQSASDPLEQLIQVGDDAHSLDFEDHIRRPIHIDVAITLDLIFGLTVPGLVVCLGVIFRVGGGRREVVDCLGMGPPSRKDS